MVESSKMSIRYNRRPWWRGGGQYKQCTTCCLLPSGNPVLNGLRCIVSQSTCFIGVFNYLYNRVLFEDVSHRDVVVVEYLCPGGRIEWALAYEVSYCLILHFTFGAGLCGDLVDLIKMIIESGLSSDKLNCRTVIASIAEEFLES